MAWDDLTEEQRKKRSVALLREAASKPCLMCGAGPFSGDELLETPLLLIPSRGLVLFCSVECAEIKQRELNGLLEN